MFSICSSWSENFALYITNSNGFQWNRASAMKSSLHSDEICLADEIKSALISRRSRISSRSDFIPWSGIYPGSKDGFRWKGSTFVVDKCGFFSTKSVRSDGINPTLWDEITPWWNPTSSGEKDGFNFICEADFIRVKRGFHRALRDFIDKKRSNFRTVL